MRSAEPVKQGGEQRGPEDDQRYRRSEADPHQPPVDLSTEPGGADEGYHVVERHDGVGDDDDPDRLQRALAGLDFVLSLLDIVEDELPGDPDQQKPSRELQQGDLEQEGYDAREDEPQRDGPGGAPDDRLAMTTALSPERMRLTVSTLTSATQKIGSKNNVCSS